MKCLSVVPFAQAWEGDVFQKLPITYNHLKVIDIADLNFKGRNEVLYFRHLLERFSRRDTHERHFLEYRGPVQKVIWEFWPKKNKIYVKL